MIRRLFCGSLMVAVVSIFLAQGASAESKDVQVVTNIEPTYTVTIPRNVAVPFNQTKTDFGAITLTQARLEYGKCVKVSLKSNKKLVNKTDAKKTIPYAIYKGTASTDGEKFTQARYRTAGEKTDLNIGITQDSWNKAFAGDYDDTVIFNIEYTK